MLPSVRGSGSSKNSEGWEHILPGSLLEPLEESLSISLTDTESQSLAVRQSAGRARGYRKSEVIWQGGNARAPMQILGPWAVIPPVEVPGSSEEVVVTLVTIVASGLGTPAAWRKVTSLAMTGRLAQMATKI